MATHTFDLSTAEFKEYTNKLFDILPKDKQDNLFYIIREFAKRHDYYSLDVSEEQEKELNNMLLYVDLLLPYKPNN